MAALARLKLSDEEAAALQKDISSILDYVGQVSGVTADAEQAVPSVRTVMRDDEPHAEGSPLAGKREKLIDALPRREGDYAVVRKIIQKDE